MTSTEETRSGDAFDYPREVQFDVPVESNSYGGTGMFFTGTVGGEFRARDRLAGVLAQVRGAAYSIPPSIARTAFSIT